MVWIIIAVVVAAALGPLLWLLPTERDRVLGNLRTAARRAGLVVEVTHLPKLNAAAEERVSSGGAAREAKIDCTAYRLTLPRRLPNAPRWLLLRSDQENRHVPGWSTLKPPMCLPTEQAPYWREISVLLDTLPGGCIAVEAGDRHISWYGRERLDGATAAEVVGGVRDGLAAIGELHRALGSGPPDDSQ